MNDLKKSDLRLLVENLRQEATEYFHAVNKNLHTPEIGYWERKDPDFFWRQVSEKEVERARSLSDRVVRYTAQIISEMRSAPLVSAEDQADARKAAKTMRAALRLRRYRFHDLEIINDEDRVLGTRPAYQTDDEMLEPIEADALFRDQIAQLFQIIKLIEASADLNPVGAEAISQQRTSNYRQGTAFIMMWMDSSDPQLFDVVDAVKETFRQFGIAAVRADDIEHEGQITQRVINEIRTSEFLFADLTGARPNVYYEVGYAHALGRHVMLYRKSGTGLHFDLAGYNCPEYTNLRDLREKLQKRLENITNRSDRHNDGDI